MVGGEQRALYEPLFTIGERHVYSVWYYFELEINGESFFFFGKPLLTFERISSNTCDVDLSWVFLKMKDFVW